MGIKTGCNEAFLVDSRTKDNLIKGDPKAVGLIRPYLRGQDISRWSPQWAGLWMIVIKSSNDNPWPWANLEADAEDELRRVHPSLHTHLKRFEEGLIRRVDKGRYWWELRYSLLGRIRPRKIMYRRYHMASELFPRCRQVANKQYSLLHAEMELLESGGTELVGCLVVFLAKGRARQG